MTTTETSLDAIAQDVRNLAASAVEQALTGDLRAGMSLSGGIDSSSVYALTGRTLPCFTGYYEGAAYDERFFARLIAGEEHHEILITPADFVEHFDDMVAAAKPPYQGPGTFGQYMVARYAAAYVGAMLSGEGADELFGGYARLMIVAGETVPDGYEDYVPPAEYPQHLQAALDWDFERLPLLLAVDEQMLGAFGVESRAPFTHPDIVDYVLALEPRLRVNKRVLKEAMRGLVPDEILDRTDKRGFPTPFVEWANSDSDVAAFVHDRIGYLPDSEAPWVRGWWLDLMETSAKLLDV